MIDAKLNESIQRWEYEGGRVFRARQVPAPCDKVHTEPRETPLSRIYQTRDQIRMKQGKGHREISTPVENSSCIVMKPKPKILLLDDDHSVRGSLVKVLELENYEVLPVNNGADALDTFRLSPVDLVVLDINLEEEDGWSLFEKMKELKPFIPAIITTTEFDQRENAVAAGAEALIEKPMDVPAFLEIVRDLLIASSGQSPRQVCGHPARCRYVPGYHTPLLWQLDERCFAPLKLSRSLNAVLTTKSLPLDPKELLPD
jgi:DNA-binding response OmpR family regulator